MANIFDMCAEMFEEMDAFHSSLLKLENMYVREYLNAESEESYYRGKVDAVREIMQVARGEKDV